MSDYSERERRVVECFASERAAHSTPPASHDAGEAVAEVVGVDGYTGFIKPLCKLNSGLKLYSADTIATLTAEVDSLRSQVARLTGERDEMRHTGMRVLDDLSECQNERDRLTEKNTTYRNDWIEQIQKTCTAYKQHYDAEEKLAASEARVAELERSEKECERLREVLHTAMEALRHSRPWDAGDAIKAALTAGEKA